MGLTLVFGSSVRKRRVFTICGSRSLPREDQLDPAATTQWMGQGDCSVGRAVRVDLAGVHLPLLKSLASDGENFASGTALA